jgi:hypothetical protein
LREDVFLEPWSPKFVKIFGKPCHLWVSELGAFMIYIDRSFQIIFDNNTKVKRGFDNKIVFKTEAKRTTLVKIFF